MEENKVSILTKTKAKNVNSRNIGKVKLYKLVLNIAGPILYFAIFLGVVCVGILEALPDLYRFSHWSLLRVNQLISIVITIEIMLNWSCVRFVKSWYYPEMHGGEQEPEINQNERDEWLGLGSGPGSHQHAGSRHENNSKLRHRKSGGTKNGRHKNKLVHFTSREPGQIRHTAGVAKRKKVFKMLVATEPEEGGATERVPYDYWSWTPCVVCKCMRPPRCHHCALCDMCVLKRDHHCFFAGTCIGVNNQRHFIVFTFWVFVGCVYAILHMIPYAIFNVLPYIPLHDLVPPVAFIRAVFNRQSFFIGLEVTLGWCLLGFVVFAAMHLYDALNAVLESRTSFEISNDIHIKDTRTNQERLAAVFGKHWWVNFIIPCHWILRTGENPVYWPTVTVE